MILKTIRIILVGIFLLNISCSKKVEKSASTQNPNGGQDSGGGDTLGSRKELVDFYLSDEKELKEGLKTILGRLLNRLSVSDLNIKSEISIEIRNKFLMEINQALQSNIPMSRNSFKQGYFSRMSLDRLDPLSDEVLKYNHNETFKAYDSRGFIKLNIFEKIVDGIKFDIQENESCLDKYKNKKTGAVYKNGLSSNTQSVICISKKELMKVSEDAIFTELNGLLLHEFMHLLGLNELEATSMQKYAITNSIVKDIYANASLTLEYSNISAYGRFLDKLLSEYNNESFFNERNDSTSKLNLFFDILFSHINIIRMDIIYQKYDIKKSKFISTNGTKYQLDNIFPEEIRDLYAELLVLAEIFYGMPAAYLSNPNVKLSVDSDCLYTLNRDRNIADDLDITKKVYAIINNEIRYACEDSKEIKKSDLIFVFNRLKFLSQKMSQYNQ